MGMFRRAIKRIVTWSMRDDNNHVNGVESVDEPLTMATIGSISTKKYRQRIGVEFHNNPDLHFKIHLAQGGYILQFSTYDEAKDKMFERLHIIPDGQDLGTNIAHIVTVELLRR